MIIGIGCDTVEISRINRALEKERFLERCFIKSEQEYTGNGEKINSLAAMFAAKEAVSKALGTGMSGIWFTDIEVFHDERGKPGVKLYGNALSYFEKLGGKYIHLSLSHDDTNAVAFVIIEG